MKADTTRSNGRKKRQIESDEIVSYDTFKEFEGQKYTGMAIGRSHKWYYDQGVWKDKKITPDLWQISYAVTKRRAGRAPEGSGVPVGTEYHWYILAHQSVHKLDANDYTTSMTGLKFKIAHKRADRDEWSATPRTQRKRMIRFLQSVIEDLVQQQDEPATASEKPARKTAAKAPGKAATRALGKAAAKAAAKAPGKAATRALGKAAAKSAAKAPGRRATKALRKPAAKARGKAASKASGKPGSPATRHAAEKPPRPAPPGRQPATPRSMTKPARRRRQTAA